MIAIDTNILVYAHRQDAPLHAGALAALTQAAESQTTWAIPWPCVHEFLAIVTHPRIWRPPTTMTMAIGCVRAWMSSPSLRLIGEGPRHLETLAELVEAGKIDGPRVHDARIAALCRQHGVKTLWSADRDFSRFPGLKVLNPAVA
jgi:toxin-antitoxin system PIN domain toxin